MADRVCSLDWCDNPVYARGHCNAHYKRLRKAGLLPELTPEQRFWPKVDKDGPVPEARPELGPCWLWTAAQNGVGYGYFKRDDGSWLAHRVAYEWEHGPIPDGLDLDHLCFVRHCVRPSHMEPTSRSVNILRAKKQAAINAAKTQCPRGHEYTDENTYLTKSGTRSCKECQSLRQRERRARLRS